MKFSCRGLIPKVSMHLGACEAEAFNCFFFVEWMTDEQSCHMADSGSMAVFEGA